MTRLPDFVVLGQGKAGTSLIYRVFGRNPDVGLSHPKELFFYNQHFDKGVDWYLSHFAHIDPQVSVVGEVCPAYLDADAVTRIHQTLGAGAGMIFILRHPIEQAYSRYLQNICAGRGQTGPIFKPAFVLKNRFEQLHSALDTLYRLYDASRILALSFERDIDVENPGFEKRICAFLGLPPSDHMNHFRRRGKVNAGVMPRFVHGGVDGQTMQVEGETYFIPPHELVFCAQPRNSDALGQVTPQEAEQALKRSNRWTAQIDEAEFSQLQEELVLPFAERLGRDFGLDLSHWDVAPHRIAYDRASPPATFLAEGSA